MKKIPLTQNKFAVVDDEDYERTNKHNWYANKNFNTFYAVRDSWIKQGSSGFHRKVFMHRLILGLKYGDGKQTDHINNNGLDNRKANLRTCTTAQNQHNRQQHKTGRSQYKGVSWDKVRRKWQVNIKIGNKRVELGGFNNEIDAAQTYNQKAKELFGKFARPNVI